MLIILNFQHLYYLLTVDFHLILTLHLSQLLIFDLYLIYQYLFDYFHFKYLN